jgi:hypothetical protein
MLHRTTVSALGSSISVASPIVRFVSAMTIHLHADPDTLTRGPHTLSDTLKEALRTLTQR